MKRQKLQSIYSLPDIDPNIEQLFIDNLNMPEIHFGDLLKKSIKEIISNNSKYMNLSDEFNKILERFICKELIEKKIKQKYNEYYTELIKYMENNPYLKEKIINKAENFLSEEINMNGTGQKLVDKMLKNDRELNFKIKVSDKEGKNDLNIRLIHDGEYYESHEEKDMYKNI